MLAAAQKPAIFIDRDGVLNLDSDSYIRSWQDFTFLPGALQALRKIAGWDVYAFLVTNQSGLARSYFTHETLEDIHRRMNGKIIEAGGRLHHVYFCPHHPNEGCSCRKPAVGLMEKAARTYPLDRRNSFMIGDSWSDILAGLRFNCFSILVKSSRVDYQLDRLLQWGERPDALVENLFEASILIEEKLFTP